MNDYWSSGWGWGDPNSHLRTSGRQLLDHADRLGWILYPEERQALEQAAHLETYLDIPLDELDVITFGAAVEKIRGRLMNRAPSPQSSFQSSSSSSKEKEKEKDKDKGKPKRWRGRGKDDHRERRWR